MKRLAIAIVAALPALASADEAFGGGVRSSHDSDGLRIDRSFVSSFPRYASTYDATRVSIEAGDDRQGEWRRHAEAVTVEHRDLDRWNLAGLKLSTTLSAVGARRLLAGDLDWSREREGGQRVGVVAARDWVETPRALDAGIHYALAGATLDQPLPGAFTAVGFYARQWFSDGNARDHLRFRLIHALGGDTGATAQLRYRGFASRRDEAEGRYFNPRRYSQALAVLALRRRFEKGWRFEGEAGYGRQWISGEPGAPSWIASAGLERVLASAIWRARAGQTRAAAFGGPGYRYRWFALELEVRPWPAP